MHDDAFTIRRAVATDIPFLVDVIISAERSGTDKLSYSTLFDLPEAHVRRLLAEMLAEDVTGQELCVSGFLIAEVLHECAGAACGCTSSDANVLPARVAN
jgi:hypothetical protein